MDKSVLWELGTQHCLLRDPGEPCVRGPQTLVPAVYPEVARDPAPAPLGHGPGTPGEHCLDNHPCMREKT